MHELARKWLWGTLAMPRPWREKPMIGRSWSVLFPGWEEGVVCFALFFVILSRETTSGLG